MQRVIAAYYNEIDAEKAAVIRELIKANVVAPGDVDERDIKLVQPDDLRGYRQCHFFAGFAVWSYALRLAGWPDDREVWTGSCPCPSFSAAGKGQGFDDARHLWPDWFRLIRECRPPVVFGEQADDAIGFGWLDLVQAQMETENYAVGKAILASASVGGADLRERLYFCADAEHVGHNRPNRAEAFTDCDQPQVRLLDGDCATGELPDTESERCGEARDGGGRSAQRAGDNGESGECAHATEARCDDAREHRSGPSPLSARLEQRSKAIDRGDTPQRGFAMCGSASGNGGHTALTDKAGIGGNPEQTRLERLTGHERTWRGPGWLDPESARSAAATGATRGFWSDCDWWYGRDGKYRPIGPGLSPLAHGAAARVLRLRGYGDAINAQVAKAFIEAYRESRS